MFTSEDRKRILIETHKRRMEENRRGENEGDQGAASEEAAEVLPAEVEHYEEIRLESLGLARGARPAPCEEWYSES